MNKRKRIALWLGLAGLAAGAFFFVSRSSEPRYQGRPLSHWLVQFTSSAVLSESSFQAAEAVHEIGTNALPYLLHEIRKGGSLSSGTEPRWAKLLGLSSSWWQRSTPGWRSACGFMILGSMADPAVPALAELTQTGDALVVRHALFALGKIGTTAASQALENCLSSTNLQTRRCAAEYLRFQGGHAASAVPTLTKLLGDSDGTLARYSAQALGCIAAHPELAVLPLAEVLNSADPQLAREAAKALGAFGLGAEPAIPYLRTAATAPDPELRRNARRALVRIQCEIREGGIVRGPREERRLALVFTGHEYAEGAEAILEALGKHGAKASFFLTGCFLTNGEFAGLLDQLVADEHYLGPHSDRHLLYCSWDRSKTTLVSRMAFRADLLCNAWKLRHILPSSPRRFDLVQYFLPAYEHYNREITDWTRDEYFDGLVNFTPGTRSNADYTEDGAPNFVSSQAIFDSIVSREREDPHGLNGYLLLFHLGAGPKRTDKFHSRFGELLEVLAAKGYQFVRVDELLEPPPAAQ